MLSRLAIVAFCLLAPLIPGGCDKGDYAFDAIEKPIRYFVNQGGYFICLQTDGQGQSSRPRLTPGQYEKLINILADRGWIDYVGRGPMLTDSGRVNVLFHDRAWAAFQICPGKMIKIDRLSVDRANNRAEAAVKWSLGAARPPFDRLGSLADWPGWSGGPISTTMELYKSKEDKWYSRYRVTAGCQAEY